MAVGEILIPENGLWMHSSRCTSGFNLAGSSFGLRSFGHWRGRGRLAMILVDLDGIRSKLGAKNGIDVLNVAR